MSRLKLIAFIVIIIITCSCNKQEFNLTNHADDYFFLRNVGADMPVWVQGNTASKTFVVMLHGGPGGSALLIDGLFGDFCDPLEEKYGMVYWDQRGSGSTQGNYSPATLHPDQYVDDLEKLIRLLEDKYGEDISFFLMGISWGGYLGNAFLLKEDNQKAIRGWMNIVGPHDFLKMSNIGKNKLISYAEDQIAQSKNEGDWQEILDWCVAQDTIVQVEDFIKQNSFANYADILMEDSISTEISTPPIDEQLAFAFLSPFSSNAWLANLRGIMGSHLIEKILQKPLDCSAITVPSMIIGGHYDFVVPEEVLREQYHQISTVDKEIHILSKSGHGLIGHETQQLISLINDFIDRY
jgi:pimeloyl-ACP methyl ester carboxylesterase